jgi:hypothetical protein
MDRRLSCSSADGKGARAGIIRSAMTTTRPTAWPCDGPPIDATGSARLRVSFLGDGWSGRSTSRYDRRARAVRARASLRRRWPNWAKRRLSTKVPCPRSFAEQVTVAMTSTQPDRMWKTRSYLRLHPWTRWSPSANHAEVFGTFWRERQLSGAAFEHAGSEPSPRLHLEMKIVLAARSAFPSVAGEARARLRGPGSPYVFDRRDQAPRRVAAIGRSPYASLDRFHRREAVRSTVVDQLNKRPSLSGSIMLPWGYGIRR